jgi:hypothetical protein
MAKQIFKMILIGILAGVALFMAPFFLVKIFIFLLLIGAIMRLWWGGGRRHRGGWGGYQFAYADKIRNMNEEEYKAFKEKMNSSSCNYYHGCGGYYDNNWNNCGNWEKKDATTENKNESTNNQ